MTNDEKILVLQARKNMLLTRGFYNHNIAAKIQRRIYQLQKEQEERKDD